MALRSPYLLGAIFALFAAGYSGGLAVYAHQNANAAKSRFDVLTAVGADKRALGHGERWLELRAGEGGAAADLAPMQRRLADAYVSASRPARAAELYRSALIAAESARAPLGEREALRERIAAAQLAAGDIENAAGIYAAFLDGAGDAAAGHAHDHIPEDPDGLGQWYADAVLAAAPAFDAQIIARLNDEDETAAHSSATRLEAAENLAEVGAFYATRADADGALDAAAGLLASAYELRRTALGDGHGDTIQTILLLGRVYSDLERPEAAEPLYKSALHAMERSRGANTPELSLYLRLLGGVYEAQERYTEAEALYVHIRALFRDAFGQQRYSANKARDRRGDFDRPVSIAFPLPEHFPVRDLVRAVDYGVPIAKNADLAEMSVRFAPDPVLPPATGEPGANGANLPARLAELMEFCQSESGQSLSLRSGYRSYVTQRDLYARNGAGGRVTPPGLSEHQLGLAVDINVFGRFMRAGDRAYQCFESRAFRYGFILSYPPGNDYLPSADPYEPWHWRYVGPETARLYREVGPMHKPMEFLAALPCYEERAAAGYFPQAGERDVCLDADAVDPPFLRVGYPAQQTAQRSDQAAEAKTAEAAPILNNSAPELR